MNRLNEVGLSAEEIEERLAQVDLHQRMSRRTSHFLRPLMGVLGGVTVLGSRDEFASRTTPSLLAFHHRSWWDIPAAGLGYAKLTHEVYGVRKYPRFVGRVDYGFGKFGDYITRRGTIFLKRGEELDGQPAEIEIDEALENGEDVLIFPKGTREKGDDFAERDLKRGIALIAMKQGTPIIPFWLARTKPLEGTSIVVVRPPIEVEKFEVESVEHDPERPPAELNNPHVTREQIRRSKELRSQIFTELMAGKQEAEAYMRKTA